VRHAGALPITSDEALERLTGLAIPPTWGDVWISPNPGAKLQATVKGRFRGGRRGNASDMGQFESLLWERRADRVGRRSRPPARARLGPSPLTEWTARPVGRLGRPLVAEIETYLEFFALARTTQVEPNRR
jgi:hypothetical protein